MRQSKTVKTILAELDRREAELADIETRVQNLDSRYKAVWAALTDDRPLKKAKSKNRKKRQTRTQPSMGVGLGDVDFTGAETRFEQLVRVAEVAPNREISINQVADLLVEAGHVPRSRVSNCRTSLYNAVKRHGDWFKRVREGWYRCTPPKEGVVVPPMKWMSGDINYAGTTNLSQRLVQMAEHTDDGRLEPEQTALRLIQDGKSRQRLDSLTRLVRKNLGLNPRFHEVGDDWYQRVDFTPEHPVRSEPDNTGGDFTTLNGYQVHRHGNPLNGNIPTDG